MKTKKTFNCFRLLVKLVNNTHTYTNTRARKHAHTHTYIQTHTHTHTYTHTYTHTRTHKYAHTYAHIHTDIHTHIHTHTHTHTHTHASVRARRVHAAMFYTKQAEGRLYSLSRLSALLSAAAFVYAFLPKGLELSTTKRFVLGHSGFCSRSVCSVSQTTTYSPNRTRIGGLLSAHNQHWRKICVPRRLS